MSTIADVVFYFGTNQDTMIAGKALRDANIVARMIPKPASVATDANLCLAVAQEAAPRASAAISGAGIALKGVVT
jgi:Putative Se/S carrier protein-like